MTDHQRQRRIWYIVGAVVVVAFLAYGATSFKSYLTPYVSFDEARGTSRKVQVAGSLVAGSAHYAEDSEVLRFGLVDDGGDTMAVRYEGVRPSNFEEATQVVAIGTWHNDAFHAEHLLVKCPSKYQGIEEDVTTHG
jgi:cytochrome c-type biogenesis protein CcmE